MTGEEGILGVLVGWGSLADARWVLTELSRILTPHWVVDSGKQCQHRLGWLRRAF